MPPYRNPPEPVPASDTELVRARTQLTELKKQLREAQAQHRASGGSARYRHPAVTLVAGLTAGLIIGLLLRGERPRDSTLRRLEALTREVENRKQELDAISCFNRCTSARGESPCSPESVSRCKSTCRYHVE